MSFGGSNPPWQRNTLGNSGQQNAIANLQSQMMNTNFVGFQGLAMPNQTQQNNLTLIPGLSANINSLNNTNALFANHQTIQYQNRSGLNPNAFGSVQATQQIIHHSAQSQPNQQSMQGNQNNAAFKWNTNLVQMTSSGQSQNHGMNVNVRPNANQPQMQHPVQSSQQQQASRNFSGYSSSQPQSNYASSFERTTNPARSTNHSSRQSPAPPARRSPERNSRREEEERKRRKEREREREKEQEKRDERSPIRRISPRRRPATRPIRYMVQVPKMTLNAPDADILELRRRYNNLYVPSDFFYSSIRWSESFPCHAPFSIKKPSAFHIFHRSVENPNGASNGASFEPSDADDTFSAKVMLMSVPPMSEFYRKCFTGADEKERDDLLHPSRLISFLVGVLGKNETMPIGGAWSPSLDGPNPEKDPSVLIKTAIRTCKALTGIDLSPCTQWYRFVELYYRRAETVRKGRTVPARTQTVVIFLPDVRSCLPTRFEWDALCVKYKKHLETKKQSNNDHDEDGEENVEVDKMHSQSKTDIVADDSIIEDVEMADDGRKSESETVNAGDIECQDKQIDSSDGKTTTDPESTASSAAISKEDKNTTSKIGPSHFSDLDVKTMKIHDLRDQLDARGLSSKGLKPQLIARLSKALKTEENEAIAADNIIDAEMTSENQTDCNISNEVNECASNDSMDIDLAHIVVIDEYDSTKTDSKAESKRSSSRKADEREHRWLEKRYRLPENPQILCHPIQNSSLDKFTCEVRSLSILLDYRPEDTKKHCFEVSLFAELFNEMLMRDFGFNIYKVLHSMPETEQTNEHESKDRRDKSIEDEPKEKRHRKDESVSDSKASKKDDASSATSHDKSKTDDKESKSNKESRSRDKDKEKEKEKSSRERRISRREEDSEDERSVDGKRRDNKKLVTVDPDLLLSFVYFDQTHCGYIFSNHLEELFYSLGLRLSRADAKKIINKVAPRSLFYRKLTDKPKDEPTPVILSETVANVEELGIGNNGLLPCFDISQPNHLNKKTVAESAIEEVKKDESPKADELEQNTNEESSHMVMHKGALVDIEKLLQQLNRSEKAREESELRLCDLLKSNSDLQSSNSKAKDKIKDLQSELKSCNRKVSDAESSLSSANKKCTDYYSILCSIHDKVAPVFVKSERSASKKESSTREKDRRDREKDKNNGASTNKEKDTKEKETKEKEMKEKETKEKETKEKETKEKEVKEKAAETKSEIKQEKQEKPDEN